MERTTPVSHRIGLIVPMLSGVLGGFADDPSHHQGEGCNEQEHLQAFELIGVMEFEAQAEAGTFQIPKGFFDSHPQGIEFDHFFRERRPSTEQG